MGSKSLNTFQIFINNVDTARRCHILIDSLYIYYLSNTTRLCLFPMKVLASDWREIDTCFFI